MKSFIEIDASQIPKDCSFFEVYVSKDLKAGERFSGKFIEDLTTGDRIKIPEDYDCLIRFTDTDNLGEKRNLFQSVTVKLSQTANSYIRIPRKEEEIIKVNINNK